MDQNKTVPVTERLVHSRKFYALDIDDEVLLTRPSANEALRLDAAAAAVWKMCDGSRTVKQVIDELAGLYPDQADTVRSDVMDAIGFLRGKAVLVPDGARGEDEQDGDQADG